MNKRLAKRHKRQVLRAKDRVKPSEPDLRTPEQVTAAREASRPALARRPQAHYVTPPGRSQATLTEDNSAKAEA
jgi:hypothetical protein